MIQKLKEIIDKHGQEVHYQALNYSQFTIDMFSFYGQQMEAAEHYEREPELTDSFVDGMIYASKNAIEIMKDGKDKEIFCELLEDLKQLKK